MSLPSMPAWGPLMPIQRPTLAVAAAAGASTLNAINLLTQPVNIQLQHVSGLQCLLVSIPGLPEGFVMFVVSPLGLGVGSCLAAGQQSGCGSPPLASSNMVVPSHLHKWLLREDRMSWMAPSIWLGPQGGRLGSLLSKYTSW